VDEDLAFWIPILGNLHNVHMVCYENLLVVLVEDTDQRQFSGQVSLWNGKNETWLTDLDISLVIPHNHLQACGVAVSKDLLAVYACGNERGNRVLFFLLNTVQPAAIPPQLIGMVETRFGEDVSVHMNEKWVGLWNVVSCELVVIKKTELFSEDQNQVAKISIVADPHPLWRKVKYASYANYLNLQPGSSNHLAVEHKLFDKTEPHAYLCMILNLETGEILSKIANSVDLLPTSWWGDAFLFLKNLKACDESDESVKLQVVTFDFSRRIRDVTVEDLDNEATCLLSGPVFEFPGAPKLDFKRDSELRQHLDYSGVVVYDDSRNNLFCAAFE
jgi:hypothetical protein